MSCSCREKISPYGDCTMNNINETKVTKGNNARTPMKDCVGGTYEVFRNNTTAVEVIIKQVSKKVSTTSLTGNFDEELKTLQEENAELINKLNRNKIEYETERNYLGRIIIALKTQLIATNKQEMDTQTENMKLCLENEKLRIVLDSKMSLVTKLKKELENIKRVIKLLIKSICRTSQKPEGLTTSMEGEYEEFEKHLKNDTHFDCALKDFFETNGTIDSIFSKDTTATVPTC